MQVSRARCNGQVVLLLCITQPSCDFMVKVRASGIGLPARLFVSLRGLRSTSGTAKGPAVLERFQVDRASFPGPVLVTGAGGCIGSWVLALLARASVPACALDLTDDKRRPRLLLPERDLAAIQWRTGDIADSKAVVAILEAVRPCAVIHLAALQVPFCKADPVAGARVNVVGTVNIFEAARHIGIKRLTYASSVAAHGAIEEELGTMRTLYGAYKYCDEQIARVYSED